MRSRCRLLASALAASLTISFLVSPSLAQVKSHAKISATEGNFSGVLDDDGRFGIGVTSLGDLDGDLIIDIAVGAYLDGYDEDLTGAAFVLFLNANGTVKSHVKIAEGLSGFGGNLDFNDEFGISVAAIGDLDNDGVVDLAIGARLDDDGSGGPNSGLNRGAVWIVFLNANGTVKSEQKISAYEGAFTGALFDNDWFGAFVTGIGDLDSDGTEDLVVGCPFCDDGGTDQGSLWVLFLNSDGTVKSHQKVSSLDGGLTAELDPGDRFGTGPGNIGDLDGDGVVDLATGAILDDDGGTDFGAVYILYMNSNGTVKSHAKISTTSGGFTGALNAGNGFGSVCALVQPGDAIQRIAVSAKSDDDGGANRGAVWLLDVYPDGTVASHSKISSTSGDFAGPLSDGDEFGLGMAPIGDFDGDGSYDVAVGARFDDDGPGGDVGAVWLIYLGACDLIAAPPVVDFGSVTVGESADAQFTLTNTGLGTVAGSIAEYCSGFSIVSGGGPFSLGPGADVVVTVRFTPAFPGTYHCTVETGAACGQIELTGIGAELPPNPVIQSIRDIPNDEGRRVRITFERSGYDRPYSSLRIEQYEIYRRIDVAAHQAAATAAPALEDWDYVTTVPVHGEGIYNVVVGTLADSTITFGAHWSVFLVRAASYDPFTFFDSAPDSGYSLDNTPPSPPTQFVVSYGQDGAHLRWNRSDGPGLLGYKVFRSPEGRELAERDFVTLTTRTEWTDAMKGSGFLYHLASVDSAGNESKPVGPDREVGGTDVPSSLALAQNMPNPFNPSTTIRYDVPAPGGRVTLAVYDVHGRLVRTLLDRSEAAGSRSVTWDGRNSAGARVVSGTYFYRIEMAGNVLTRKMTLLE